MFGSENEIRKEKEKEKEKEDEYEDEYEKFNEDNVITYYRVLELIG
jgi:hypothetical protein